MSFISFIADTHIANHRRFAGESRACINVRCHTTLNSLEQAVESARGTLVVLGDIFDTVRPEPQVIAAVQLALWETHTTFLLLGNHDMVSTQPGDHALGPLAHAGRKSVV